MAIPAIIAAAGRLAVGFFRGKAAAKGVRAGAGGRAAKRTASSGGAVPYPWSTPKPAIPVAPPAARETALDRMWRYDTAWNLFDRTQGMIAGHLPSFVHAIQVSVIGGPAADLRRVWFLACAAAFGRLRKRVDGVADINIEGVWDVTGKAASVNITYTLSGIPGNVGGSVLKIVGGGLLMGVGVFNPLAFGAGLGLIADGVTDVATVADPGGTRGGLLLMQEGPDQVTVGDAWPAIFRPDNGFSLVGSTNTDTGVYNRFNLVAIKCAEDQELTRFTQSKPVNVLGELPFSEGLGKRVIPFGQVIGVAVYDGVTGSYSTNARKPYSTRQLGVALSAVGLPIASPGMSTPLLPDDGRLITTGEKRDPRVQPPRPWVDGESRMSTLELIVQVLHQPCLAPKKIECPVVPAGGSGLELYKPGKNKSWDANSAPKLAFIDPTNPKVMPIPRLGE